VPVVSAPAAQGEDTVTQALAPPPEKADVDEAPGTPIAPAEVPAGASGAAGAAADPGALIEQFAIIAAELTMKAERADVLKAHGLSEESWIDLEERWANAMTQATESGDRGMLEAFDAAYVAAQERMGKRLGVGEYARILVGIERGEVGRVLAELELKLSDLVRVQRVWSKRLASSPELGIEVEKAVEAARGAGV
jgi:hypothetical protein